MYTIMYMSEFGVANVRGGSFTQIDLDPVHVITIKSMIESATGLCYRCKGRGHAARECLVSLIVTAGPAAKLPLPLGSTEVAVESARDSHETPSRPKRPRAADGSAAGACSEADGAVAPAVVRKAGVTEAIAGL